MVVLPSRRFGFDALGLESFLQLTRLEHFTNDIAAADELALDVKLRNGRPVGKFLDVIVKEVETSNQPNSQGTTDADVPAEEGQAKEGAWELFTG